MAKRVGVDKWLFGVVLLLVLFGLVMVFSASAVVSQSESGSPYKYVGKQALFGLVGLVAMVLLMRVDYRRYNNPRVVFPMMAAATLLLLSVFAMHPLNHTHRWFKFGSFTFQPSELATPLIVLFLAYFLQTRIYKMDDWKGTILRASLPPLVFIALIMKEPDLGTALVCAGVAMAMLYLAGMQIKWIGIAALASSPVMYYMLWMVPFRRARMETFIHPELDPTGQGIPHHAVAHRGRYGRRARPGPDGRTAEALLPTRGMDRLYLREYLRRAWAAGVAIAGGVVCVLRLSWAARSISFDRSIRTLPGIRPDDGDPDPGVLQHQRRSGAAAH